MDVNLSKSESDNHVLSSAGEVTRCGRVRSIGGVAGRRYGEAEG